MILILLIFLLPVFSAFQQRSAVKKSNTRWKKAWWKPFHSLRNVRRTSQRWRISLRWWDFWVPLWVWSRRSLPWPVLRPQRKLSFCLRVFRLRWTRLHLVWLQRFRWFSFTATCKPRLLKLSIALRWPALSFWIPSLIKRRGKTALLPITVNQESFDETP